MAKGLASSNIESVFLRQQMDKAQVYNQAYPYNPDLLIGWHGRKAGLFIVPDRQVMHDTGDVDGITASKLKLLEDGQKDKSMFTVGIPISNIASYDLANYQLSLKKDFDLLKVIDEA